MTSVTTPPPPAETEVRQIASRMLGDEPIRVETIRGGAWSHAFGLLTATDAYVLRFSMTDEDFRRDAVAAQFSGPDLPIPDVLAIGQYPSGWWCLSRRAPGTHLDTLSAHDLRMTVPSLAAMLMAMRQVDNTDSHGYGSWDTCGNGCYESFAEQLLSVQRDDPARRDAGWSTQLKQQAREAAIFSRGCTLLTSQTRFLSDDRALIHMDMLNFNVNVENHRISGIYDWGCAMWGDPVYDLAWFAFWEPWYPQWSEMPLADTLMQEVNPPGPFLRERLISCMLHIGLDHIRYNAFTGNHREMTKVAYATERVMDQCR